ncbi:hypothetical protein FOA52_010298 [Chlamydomonas sp. UWO 241]|nr:hypothetical protein FOA52_010298 [Chlamydomonas sp. UWO 241]
MLHLQARLGSTRAEAAASSSSNAPDASPWLDGAGGAAEAAAEHAPGPASTGSGVAAGGPPRDGVEEVPFEIAAGVAALGRAVRAHRLPPGLSSALADHLGGSGMRPAELKEAGMRLLHGLKAAAAVRQKAAAAVTAARAAAERARARLGDGGVGSGGSGTGVGGPGSRRGAAALDRAVSAMELDGIGSMDDATANTALGLPPPIGAKAKGDDEADSLSPQYGSAREVAGYVVGRAAGAHAAVTRVLSELVRSDPGFRPKSVLDAAARAGCHVSAVTNLWPGATRGLLAVEPSRLMGELGARVITAAGAAAHAEWEEEVAEWQREKDAQGLHARGRHGGAGAPARAPPPRPRVTWARALPGLDKSPALKRRFDLTLCAFGLGEEPGGEKARRRLVRRLWDMTGDVLVIIEPGTPAGFAHIKAARAQILAVEQKRRKTALGGGGDGGDGGEGMPAAELDNSAAIKAAGSGVHIVAPCAHDGACPMEGRRMWCHFGQRIERPGFVKAVLPGARGHADETFSYVILRRGPRAAVVPMVAIAREPAQARAVDTWAIPESVLQKQILINRLARGTGPSDAAGGIRAPLGAEEQLRQQVGGFLDRLAAEQEVDQDDEERQRGDMELLYDDEPDFEDDADGGSDATAVPEPSVPGSVTPRTGDDAASIQLLRALAAALDEPPTSSGQGMQSGQGSGAQRAPRARLFSGPAVQQEPTQVAGADGAAAVQPLTAAASEFAVPGSGPVIAAFDKRFPAFSRGLVDRLAAMEDQGIQWSQEGAGGLTVDAAELSATLAPALGSSRAPQQQEQAQPQPQLQAGSDVEALSPDQERAAALVQLKQRVFGLGAEAAGDATGLQNAEEDEDAARDADAAINLERFLEEARHQQLAIASSSRWPRIYRPPRARGGHVIMDLCVADVQQADSSTPGAAPTEGARLERHTVTRSDMKGWMGRSAWQMAREVEWGDLWPSWYTHTRRRIAVHDPDSKEAQARNKAAAGERHAAEQDDLTEALKSYGFERPKE